jgi:hypothetical protein
MNLARKSPRMGDLGGGSALHLDSQTYSQKQVARPYTPKAAFATLAASSPLAYFAA